MNLKKNRRLFRGKKNVDIPNFKFKALQCSWIRRLYDNSFHEQKLILHYEIEKSFGRSFKFHSNLHFKNNKTNSFQSFYREITLYWKKYLAMMTKLVPFILSQYLWFNMNIQVVKTSIHLSRFSKKILFMLHNFLITMDPLKNSMSLRENTIYIRILISMGTNNRLYSRKMEIYH